LILGPEEPLLPEVRIGLPHAAGLRLHDLRVVAERHFVNPRARRRHAAQVVRVVTAAVQHLLAADEVELAVVPVVIDERRVTALADNIRLSPA
jgi:hypothetical protein